MARKDNVLESRMFNAYLKNSCENILEDMKKNKIDEPYTEFMKWLPEQLDETGDIAYIIYYKYGNEILRYKEDKYVKKDKRSRKRNFPRLK